VSFHCAQVAPAVQHPDLSETRSDREARLHARIDARNEEMTEQSDSKDPALQTPGRRMTMTGKHAIAQVASPEEAERLYSILVKQGRFVFEDEFRKALPDVELCWPTKDNRRLIYRWQVEGAAYMRAEAARVREEEERRQL
jgi:hypothetical protein